MIHYFRRILYFFFPLALVGCTHPGSVHVRKIIERDKDRGSAFVGSPDLNAGKNRPNQYRIRYAGVPDVESVIRFEVVYDSMKQEIFEKNIGNTQGVWHVIPSGGEVLTYRAQLFADGELVDQSSDVLYFSLIEEDKL